PAAPLCPYTTLFRSRGDDRQGALAVAAVDGLEEVRLLRLGGQSGGGSAALDIDDDQRQFGHHRETHRFCFQREAGTAGSGHPERSEEHTSELQSPYD